MSVNQTTTNDVRSSPRLASKQRGVLLPLLKEKDNIIQTLEGKIVSLETKANDCKCDKTHAILIENDKINNENKSLQNKNDEIRMKYEQALEEIKDNEDKIFDLENKNMKLLKELENEQHQTDTLQAEILQLSQNRVNAEEVEDSLDEVVENFLEKLSNLCRDQNLKINVSSNNVKLQIRSRASNKNNEDQGSSNALESTHLCEETLTKCRDFRQINDLKDLDEAYTSNTEELEVSNAAGKDHVKMKKYKSSVRSSKQDLNISLGMNMNSLSIDDVKSPEVVHKRLTRSMSRRQ